MIDSKDFLLTGRTIGNTSNPHLGVKFISLGSGALSLIGEVVQIIDSIMVIKDPIIVGRNTANARALNFIKFNNMFPMVKDEIEVPMTAVGFMCKPEDSFVTNYNAAKAGLVTAVGLPSNNTSKARCNLKE